MKQCAEMTEGFIHHRRMASTFVIPTVHTGEWLLLPEGDPATSTDMIGKGIHPNSRQTQLTAA